MKSKYPAQDSLSSLNSLGGIRVPDHESLTLP